VITAVIRLAAMVHLGDTDLLELRICPANDPLKLLQITKKLGAPFFWTSIGDRPQVIDSVILARGGNLTAGSVTRDLDLFVLGGSGSDFSGGCWTMTPAYLCITVRETYESGVGGINWAGIGLELLAESVPGMALVTKRL